jgi:carbonic anhydrase
MTAGGTMYQLSQFHFHSPAEDLINGKSTNLEIHFVNESADGGKSGLAVFVRLGAHN